MISKCYWLVDFIIQPIIVHAISLVDMKTISFLITTKQQQQQNNYKTRNRSMKLFLVFPHKRYINIELIFFFRGMENASSQQNGTQNETSYLEISSSECIAWLTVFMTESVAIVTLNILKIIVFIKKRSLRKRSMYLVINLAVADMFAGGCSEITYFVKLGLSCSFWNTLRLPSVVFYYSMYLFPAASLINLIAISLERTHATFRPFRHRIIKKWVFGFIITIIWVTTGLSRIALYYLRSYQAIYSNHVIGSLAGFCIFIICVSYASIAVKFSRGNHPQNHGAASRERKLTKTLFIMTVVSLLLWLPFTIFHLLPVNSFLPWWVDFRLFFASSVLFFANSLVNPILYAIKMPDFKRALVSLFRRQQRQVEVIPLGPLWLSRVFVAHNFCYLVTRLKLL